ncbi:MAG: DUF2007 domain-containing protein [Melioribacter sp.]|uniref:putative signal transducing protein n=1 Tax=Rosettibacter primus TaxID=3111523 RepID=UPI00247DA057|nr:DUF2007 domain-containing protein [Melioribacter sp.]
MDNENESIGYYCSNCNSPVKVDDKICLVCGANLDETTEVETDINLVEIKICANEFEAQLILSHLQSNNIDVILSRDDCGSMKPHLQLSRGIRILVKETDVDKAVEILNAMES